MEATEIRKEKQLTLNQKSRQRYLKHIYKHNQHNIELCTDCKCITFAKSYVANLSGRILLLSKGLSFIPTARDANNFELLTDFNKFCNKSRSFFKNKFPLTTNNDTIPKKLPLNRIQKLNSRQAFFSSGKFEGLLKKMKIKISEIFTTDSIPHNLSLKERKALGELKNNTDLIINKAYKGSTIVQNRADYIRVALEHLDDPITYKQLDGDPTRSIRCGLNEFLICLYKKGLLNKKTGRLLLPATKS